jgi:hypothetical protein
LRDSSLEGDCGNEAPDERAPTKRDVDRNALDEVLSNLEASSRRTLLNGAETSVSRKDPRPASITKRSIG